MLSAPPTSAGNQRRDLQVGVDTADGLQAQSVGEQVDQARASRQRHRRRQPAHDTRLGSLKTVEMAEKLAFSHDPLPEEDSPVDRDSDALSV